MNHDITYVRIDSKVDAKLDFINTNSNFWIHLKHPIHLNEGATLALTDISFPNSFKTVVNKIENKFKQKIFFSLISETTKFETFSAVVPDLLCYDEISLEKKLNEIFLSLLKNRFNLKLKTNIFLLKIVQIQQWP